VTHRTRVACVLASPPMIPIHELLNRIRWDYDFSQGEFVLGFFDRVEHHIKEVPLREINFPAGDHFAFEFTDAEGVTHSVPFHRVRRVYKDGALIWSREKE
jgi:uncharacterized protein (UPF0248 family)